jgi:hypothetical protein
VSRNQPQLAASTSRSSFVNGKDDTTTESRSSFVQGEDDTTIEPLSAAERDYGNDNDSYEPYSHDRSNDDTSLDDDDEEECSLLHHLFAPPGSKDDEDGQPPASNLDAAAPGNPYEHQDAEIGGNARHDGSFGLIRRPTRLVRQPPDAAEKTQ